MKQNSHARYPAVIHQFKNVVVNSLANCFFKFLERLHLRHYVVAEDLGREFVENNLLEIVLVFKNNRMGNFCLLPESA